ncbi:MAG: hypothetical protein R2813_02150 [Flavobacteriales bacterium]
MLDHWIDILNERVPSAEEHTTLVSLADQYPFASAVQTLKARSAKLRNEPDFESIAIEAAIRSADRKVLHSFVFADDHFVAPAIEQEQQIEIEQKEVETEKPEPAQQEPEMIHELDRLLVAEALSAGAAIELLEEDEIEAITELHEVEVQEELISPSFAEASDDEEELEPEEVEVPLRDKMSFSSWMEALADPSEVQEVETPKPSVIAKKDTLAIIDHFIENESSLVPKRAEFFSPAKAAKNSLIDHDEIVSETLASIYAAQGNYKKAISTYEKLGLLHPEKSSYFAALISKLKQNK